jgi:RimJ/RimL family protein N-acetyltransferase
MWADLAIFRQLARGCRSLVAGLACVVVSGVLVTRPITSLAALAVLAALVAAALLATGVISLASARISPSPAITAAAGAGWTVAGIVVLAWPGITIFALAIVVGVTMILGGTARIISAVRGTADQRVAAALSGPANKIFGVLALSLPDATMLVIAVVFGARTVFFGLSWLVLVFWHRNFGAAGGAERPWVRLRRWCRVAGSVMTLALLVASSAVHKSATWHARPAPARPDLRRPETGYCRRRRACPGNCMRPAPPRNHPARMRTYTVQRRDWREYREIRLAALKDTPSAFNSTWQEEASLAPPLWMEQAQRSQDGETLTIVVAVDDAGRWVGLAGGYRPGNQGVDAELISMWVAPDCRGTGISIELVRAVLAWAEAHGASTIGLWVNKASPAAISLYDKTGFRRTGEVDKLPSDPAQQEIRMLRCTKRAGT